MSRYLATVCVLVGLSTWGVAGEFKPLLEQATLEADGATLKPLHVHSPPRLIYLSGSHRLMIKGDSLTAIDVQTGRDFWTVKSPDGRHLGWLGGTEELAYLFSFQPDANGQLVEQALPLEVQRLDLKSKQWLKPLLPPGSELKEGQKEMVGSLVANLKYAVLLSYTVERTEPGLAPKTVSYRLTCFKAGEEKPLWSTSYASQGERSSPGAFLLASASRPDYAIESIKKLAFLGEQCILVCAGPKEAVRVIALEGGGEAWKQENLWEFQRGFIGPSVWEHYIGRFGREPWVDNNEEEKPEPGKPSTAERLAAARADFNKHFDGSIIAGPEIVPIPFGVHTFYRVFVVVAKGPAGHWTGYLSDCIVYELRDDSGGIEGMVTLPRMVNGWQVKVMDGAAVWGCQRGGMVRVDSLDHEIQTNKRIFGLGAIDMVANINWYRELQLPKRQAWFRSDPAGEATCFADNCALRVIEGGYVLKNGDHVYRFPISVVNLTTTQQEQVQLNIPFEGDFSGPKENFAQSGENISTMGPYKLAITGLEINGQTLKVTLGQEDKATSVEFDLQTFLKKRVLPRE